MTREVTVARSHGKTVRQMRMQLEAIYDELARNPTCKIQVCSPNQEYAQQLSKFAAEIGMTVELTIPEQYRSLWIAKVHSIKKLEATT